MLFLGFRIDKREFYDPTGVSYSTHCEEYSLRIILTREKIGIYLLDAHVRYNDQWEDLNGVIQFTKDGKVLVHGSEDGKLTKWCTPTNYGFEDIKDIFWNAEERKAGFWIEIFGHSIHNMAIEDKKFREGMDQVDGKHATSDVVKVINHTICHDFLEACITTKTVGEGHFDYDKIVTIKFNLYLTSEAKFEKLFEAKYSYIYDKGEWIGYYLKLPSCKSHDGKDYNAKTRETRIAIHELIKRSGILS